MSEQLILTNHAGADRSRTWERTSFRPQFERFSAVEIIDNCYKAFQLFRLRKEYQVVVLGGGAQYDLFYLILQRLWPLHVRPVVKIDCLWYRASPLRHFCKKMLFRCLDRVVARYVVWCQREIDDYSQAFDLPESKFIFIPYHTTIDDIFEIKDRGYLFSGGNFARDYQTLVEAVRGLALQVIIACTNSRAVEQLDLPDNVTVVGVSDLEFRKLMAESGINVLALDSSLLHSGGQQTFLNAMAMGKPVIVTDPEAGRGYIENGVDGILVPGGDHRSLRVALLSLIDDPEYAARLGTRAREKAQQMDTESHLAAISDLALGASIQTVNSLNPAV